MKELVLIENPKFAGRRGRNPVYVAPFSYTRGHKRVHVPGYVKHLPGERNPRGGKMSKNPLGVATLQREWLGGMDMMDMGAALGGLASSTMLPGMLIKDTTTTGNKILKAVVAFACAAGAGFVFRNVSPSAGKYAIAGGVAGALAQTIGAFTNVKIGNPRMLRTSTVVSPSFNREQESVQLITP